MTAERRDWTLARVFCAVIVLACVAGTVLPMGIGWDFANFYDTGRRVLAGEWINLFRPDELIAGQAPQGGLQFFGAPLSAFLYTPLALLPPIWALFAFKLATTVAYFAGLFLLYREYKPFAAQDAASGARFAALFAGSALIFQPFWTVYRVGGQTTAVVFLLLVCALIALTRERFLPAALCFAVAVMIKPAFAPALAFLAVIAGWRFFFSVAAVLSGFGVVSLLLLGWDVHREFLDLMILGSARANVAWPFSSSLFVGFTSIKRIVSPEAGAIISKVSLAGKLLMVVVMALLVRQSYREKLPRAAQLHFCFVAALSFCLFTSEVLWEHYLVMLFFLLSYVVAARRYFSRSAQLLVAFAIILSAGQNLLVVNFVANHFRFETVPAIAFISLLKSGPLLLALIFLLLHQRELFGSYRSVEWSARKDSVESASSSASAAEGRWAVPSKANA